MNNEKQLWKKIKAVHCNKFQTTRSYNETFLLRHQVGNVACIDIYRSQKI